MGEPARVFLHALDSPDEPARDDQVHEQPSQRSDDTRHQDNPEQPLACLIAVVACAKQPEVLLLVEHCHPRLDVAAVTQHGALDGSGVIARLRPEPLESMLDFLRGVIQQSDLEVEQFRADIVCTDSLQLSRPGLAFDPIDGKQGHE